MLPSLPTELVITVLSIAAAGDRSTAARLCQVSKWVRDLAEPILYRVITLRYTDSTDLNKYLSSTKYRSLVRCFGVVTGHFPSVPSNSDGERPLSVRNFASDSTRYNEVLEPSEVEEFHLLALYLPTRGFSRLKRIHLTFTRRNFIGVTPFLVEDILRHPRLTHIAFSVSEEPRMTSLMTAVAQLLKEHKPLVVLFVRLLPSTSVVISGAVDYESIEGQLASLGDRRLVIQRVRIDPNPRSLLDEWEKNALNGESLWDGAQAQLNARYSLERRRNRDLPR